MKNIAVIIVLICLVFFVACSQPKVPEEGAPPKETTEQTGETKEKPAEEPAAVEAESIEIVPIDLSEEEKEKMNELLGSVKNGAFPSKELSDGSNANIFLYLAQTETDDTLIAAALEGMNKTWTSLETDKKRNLVTPIYNDVVLKYLSSDNMPVLNQAISASENSLSMPEPDERIIDKVLAIALDHKEPAAKSEAYNTLYRVKDFQKNNKIAKAFLKGLDNENAFVQSTVLFRLLHNNYQIVDKEDFEAKAKELLDSKDAGVRGRALELLSKIVSDNNKDELIKKADEMLSDSNSFVRSKAASVLADLGHLPAVHKFISMLDDKEKNTYDISYTNLAGRSDRVHHDGSAWSRVNDAVLYALQGITYSMGDKQFKYGKIDWQDVDGDIDREVGRAKEWYEQNKTDIPAE